MSIYDEFLIFAKFPLYESQVSSVVNKDTPQNDATLQHSAVGSSDVGLINLRCYLHKAIFLGDYFGLPQAASSIL